MKRNFYLIVLLLTCEICNAQVTYEHAYNIFPTYWVKPWYVTDIGNNDYKYVTVDTAGFSVYNLDHTPYLIGFVPPIPLRQPPSYYGIAYLTKSLFDCDSSTLEYAIVPDGSAVGNFYVYRTDGTLLFQRDSCTGMYCFGCADGSVFQQPIVNTPNGSKLYLAGYNSAGSFDSVYVYSLCGNLPTMVRYNPSSESFVKLFPNPSSGVINFMFDLPNNTDKFEINIYNAQFQLIETETIKGQKYQFDFANKGMTSGTYLFDIKANNKVLQAGKFIITK